MFERFTESARQVVVLAQEEAQALAHNYIGTEHILLGLLREQESLASGVLESLGITLAGARDGVVQFVGRGEETTSGQIPFTPRAKKVLELALREALGLHHNYIGTEHVLLGLVREGEGVAGRILADREIDPERVRAEVLRRLDTAPPGRPGSVGMGGQQPGGWLDGVGPLLGKLAGEIRRELGREPDPGDLLLVMACAGGGLPARALAAMGIDLDALWGNVERLRQDEARVGHELAAELEAVAAAKQRALDEQRFDAAAELRDRERLLRERSSGAATPPPEVLAEIRRRLGIPATPQHG